jgi:hypothetical protein
VPVEERLGACEHRVYDGEGSVAGGDEGGGRVADDSVDVAVGLLRPNV